MSFENYKLLLVTQVFIFSLIFIVISGCYQDNYKTQDKEALENFEYSPIQSFDPSFLDLPNQMKQHKHVHIERDPFTLNDIQGTHDLNDANKNTHEDNLGIFDIDTLKMVGSIVHNAKWWGLIKTPNRAVHTVSVGRLLDHDFYLVTEITSDEIYLLNIHSKSFDHNTQLKVLELNPDNL